MNFFEQQHRNLTRGTAFQSTRCSYVGRTCLIPLDDGRIARMGFVTCGTHEKYEALKITILNKANGVIDDIQLHFNDYFAPKPVGTSGITKVPHIWTYNGEPSWYIQPTSAEWKRLAAAAREYISLFE